MNNNIIDEIQIYTSIGWKTFAYLTSYYKGIPYSRYIGRSVCRRARLVFYTINSKSIYRLRYKWECGTYSRSFSVGA